MGFLKVEKFDPFSHGTCRSFQNDVIFQKEEEDYTKLCYIAFLSPVAMLINQKFQTSLPLAELRVGLEICSGIGFVQILHGTWILFLLSDIIHQC